MDEYAEKQDIIVGSQEELIGMIDAAAQQGGSSGKEVLQLRESMRGSVDALTRSALPNPKPELSEATVHQQMALRMIARMKPREAEAQATKMQEAVTKKSRREFEGG